MHYVSPMLRQHKGFLETRDPDPTKSKGQKAVVACETFTCRHRGEIVRVPPHCRPNDMPGAVCWGCRSLICARCAAELWATNKCVVIEQRLEQIEARDRLHRAS